MTPHRFPALHRELGLLRRTLVAATVLFTVAVVFIYVTFDPSNRYRILSEPMMLRSVLLPGALLLGGLLGWTSFVAEMRSGTWDGWLLLPRSRLALVATKTGVALIGGVLALLVPVAVLWSIMRGFGNLGGPLIGWDEILFQSAFAQAALVVMSSHLAAANAALLAREGRVGFLAPLLLPLIATWRFFIGDEGVRGISAATLSAGWLVAVLLMLALVLLTVGRHGKRISSIQSSLRAVLSMPVTGVALMIVCLLGYDVVMRVVRDTADRDWSDSDLVRAEIGEDGTISTENDSISMYALRTSEAWEEPPAGRLRTPLHNLGELQIFRERDRHVLEAYDQKTGAELGCIGTGGLGPCAGAAPFDSQPSVLWLSDGAAIVTMTTIYGLDAEGAVNHLWTGRSVRSAVEMGEMIALVGDEDLLVVKPGAEEGQVVLEVACAGAAPPGHTVEGAVVVEHPPTMDTSEDAVATRPFTALRATLDDDPAQEVLMVCREGGVQESIVVRHFIDDLGEGQFGRGDAQALVVGPLMDALAKPARPYRIEAAWPHRAWLTVGFAALVTLLGGAVSAFKRRAFPWWVLPGIALGPSYVLAGLFITWRRARWAGLVGGTS